MKVLSRYIIDLRLQCYALPYETDERTNTTDYTKLNLDDDNDEDDDKKEQEVKISYDDDPFPEQLILWFVGEFIG